MMWFFVFRSGAELDLFRQSYLFVQVAVDGVHFLAENWLGRGAETARVARSMASGCWAPSGGGWSPHLSEPRASA